LIKGKDLKIRLSGDTDQMLYPGIKRIEVAMGETLRADRDREGLTFAKIGPRVTRLSNHP
jgi:hypothetical protein